MTIVLKEAARRKVTRKAKRNGKAREASPLAYSQQAERLGARSPLAAALALVKSRDAAKAQSARTFSAADDLEAIRAEQTDWH